MEIAANLSWLYRELPWAERFAAARADGFRAAEILLPYDESPDWYARHLEDAGLQLVLFNTQVREGPGARGMAAVPGMEADFRAGFDRALAVAKATGCKRIHFMGGNVAGLDAAACMACLRKNIAYALKLAEREGIALMLEPLNRTDMGGYCYWLPQQVIALLQEFDTPSLRLQFDLYHCAMEGLDLLEQARAAAPWIGHVQVAGTPGRHEPDLAQGTYLQAMVALPSLGYDSWIGCEYGPRTTAIAGLDWCEPLRRAGVLA